MQALHCEQSEAAFGRVLFGAVPTFPLSVFSVIDDPGVTRLGPGVGFAFAKLIPRDIVENTEQGWRLFYGVVPIEDLLKAIVTWVEGIVVGPSGKLFSRQWTVAADGVDCCVAH